MSPLPSFQPNVESHDISDFKQNKKTRRATVMVNFGNMIFCLLAIASVYVMSNDIVPIDEWFEIAKETLFDELDDDDLQNDMHTMLGDYVWVLYTFYGVGMLFSVIGIEGAIHYQRCMVLSCALWYLLQGFVSLVLLGWGGLGILFACLLAYPNIMLYQEICEGIMTATTYSNEIYSCCCVPAPEQNKTMLDAIENRYGVFS